MIFRDRRYSSKRHHGSNIRGLTLIELMIAITVLGILLALAVPSFRDAALNSSLRAISSNLYASVQFARSEAIKRNVPITLCRANTTGTACDVDSDWAAGWIVIASGTVLQYQQPVNEGFKVAQSGTAANVVFQPIGVGATVAAFTVCRSVPVGNQKRIVNIGATGLAYVTSADTSICP